MRFFVFEHVSGGGMAGDPVPRGLARQGRAMLEAVARELRDAGASVTTTRDARIELELDGVGVRPVERDPAAALDALSADADRSLVIAPECGGVLAGWLDRLARGGRVICNAGAEAAALCGDKLALSETWRAAGVPTPHTRPASEGPSDFPAVVKPRFGAGAESTRRVRRVWDWPGPADEAVAQPWVEGEAASVAFLVRDGRADPLVTAAQNVAWADDLASYRGGALPLDGSAAERAIDLGRRALAPIRGLRGLIGVDLVIGADAASDTAIEINPRATVSVAALANAAPGALGPALLGAAFDGPVPLPRYPFDAAAAPREA